LKVSSKKYPKHGSLVNLLPENKKRVITSVGKITRFFIHKVKKTCRSCLRMFTESEDKNLIVWAMLIFLFIATAIVLHF